MRLRQKLFLILGLMTSIPLLVLLFGVVERIESDLEQRITAELQDTLSTMSTEVDSIISSQIATVKGLSHVPGVNDFISTAYERDENSYDDKALALKQFFLDYQKSVSAIQALRVTDETGKTILKVKEGKNIEPLLVDNDRGRYYIADQSQRSFFREALNTSEQVFISDFELGQVQKDAEFCPAMLRYSVPIRNEKDTFTGMLIVNMWGTRIDTAVQATMSGQSGKVYIVEANDNITSRDGVYLYHHDTQHRFANQLGTPYRFDLDVGEDVWKTLRAQAEPGSMKLNDGRILFYNQYSPYPDGRSKWLLVVETSEDIIFQPIAQLRSTILYLLVILLVVSLLVAVWVAGRLAQPVQHLARVIDRYKEGERRLRYREKRSDDIGVAGKAFNSLCEKIEKTKKERDKAQKAAEQAERLAAVGQMAAGIGHEINNPLLNIMSLATLAEQSISEKNNQQAEADLSLLKEEGKRCASIVQGILNFSRSSEPVFEEFNLSELLVDTLELLQHKFDKKNLVADRTVQPDLKMRGDKSQIQQVLVNVFLNAIYASPEGEIITITAYVANQNKIIVKILDHGDGITRDDAKRIFNPFFSTKPVGQGTGMGLSVSYGIIDKHHGKISIENAKDAGAIVKIILPLATSEQEERHAGIKESAAG